MDEQRRKLVMVALFSGALVIIAVGLAVALGGATFGWIIVAFGILDLATIPIVARAITRSAGASPSKPGSFEGATEVDADTASEQAADPTADPSDNPYAREE